MTNNLTLDLENTRVRIGLFVAGGLLVVAFGFGVNVTRLENRVSAVEQKTTAAEAQYSKLQESVTQLLIQQTTTQTQLQGIQNDLTDIKKKL